MKKAAISFKGKTAFNAQFDDIYFNTDKPWCESEYVFAKGLDEIWHEQDRFIVAETGFGAGLNFLTLCKKFQNSGKRLHFVSIEANPIAKHDLAEIYENLGKFKTLAKKLARLYPPLVRGIHRIEFSEFITLDLCFGDVLEILPELDFKADVWFMDGFAPSKNEAMWSEAVFKHIACLTRLGGMVRTYSCAKIVRERLVRAGFWLELRKGYGKKRQMSHAVLKQSCEISKDPWFARCETALNLARAPRALIIGAGIAGLATAVELRKNGFDVTLAEAKDAVATNGSGNYCGVLMPLITKPDVNLGRMHLNAFLQAVRFYRSAMSERYIKFSGCIDYAYDELLAKRFESWRDENADEIFKFDKAAKPYPAMFIKGGAYVRPRKMCEKIAKDLNVLFAHEYLSHKHLKNGQISVKFKNAKSLKTDVLVFATGSKSAEIFKEKEILLSSVRGQVTHIEPLVDTHMPFSAFGYVCPSIGGVQVIGATYARNEFCDEARDEDDAENLSKVSEFLDSKKARIIGSKVGYRSYSSDRFPVIGALYDEEFYKQSYKDLFWSKHKDTNPTAVYEPNVFVNIAHGSRGLCTAILGAKLIGDLVIGRPLCIEKSLFNDLHAARFLVRRLKRGQK
ncbi:bifunctional tRNA (5-methylaminomethyl-2-thiouridine)(34)-methyltransferase MnmD/FAD-dependent 5-carboxymethylaminomethyl-2-thiouridine(34) oxidoreductase MnmC [Campylobacter curvus]|uniref:bifunctional tRNA (5-methylaminomethyl-2-thiouridine)(34)-methyltransferase MnmD/FAD-dependent 5-carboxymethylaminomethyl-2-thiouridine(34) oxidoreductase MnmC n=1 Tax=Campylobacter curvus TaxID=200 RepID=UPI00147047A8|nr:bifunctional tRNA (5-methylaminomethyl-2-thiouridine)(34)-methyltransferase MnmD/FAD-dependent 5-carboxymethylaminomethyl-2-thiouridine(34) oxidoreductase MnmC [Campylobacter curvus]